MLEKFKKILNNKEKKMENMIFLLILLIITLIMVSSILKEDKKEDKNQLVGAELAEANEVSSSLEQRIESILSKIVGVGDVAVLLTYAEDKLEGSVIVSEGANDMGIKKDIVEAVEAITGLGKHKIQVYPMKNEKGGI